MRYILGIALVVGSLIAASLVRAQDCSNWSCLDDQIRQLQRDRELSMAATAPLEAELKKLDKKLQSIEAQITAAE
ncbi:MAG: hypothetical protein A2784_01890 [Candidatus Chisholmbacteria bacterium RIFCSPHIGHO2_01_FULL_48_12]|uniref:Uncharacterized protein n=1 Tax=Candidatus Chisholmbacteria bacterium RIFCSPHIGHO2_01_FULL_48_12 TaxID=1797589 RepID=A0A1G1VQ22_9BACT|nr:MAG: hypothetical protein A2784_01890 [Candidatus Chisholmbacteria bacterium RIFCSPHIGHO2_01_FULL_48_12]